MNSPAIARSLRAFAKRTHLDFVTSKANRKIDWSGWRSFAIAVVALGAALLLALYSSVAAEDGRIWAAGFSALSALAVSGWVAFTVVPALARRTPLRWLAYRMDYRVTREGVVYLAGIFVIALAALNTGNNLLFMTLACLLAGILVSGIISQVVLSGVELRLDLPENIFANQPVLALTELENHKTVLPSFSLRLVGGKSPRRRDTPSRPAKAGSEQRGKSQSASEILTTPVYFPYLPPQQKIQQAVEPVFPHRGIYRQDSIGLQTSFPFGFLEKTRQVESRMEALVYPSVAPSEEFYEILPLVTGELESFMRDAAMTSTLSASTRLPTAPAMWTGRLRHGPARCRCANSPAKTSAEFCWCSIRRFPPASRAKHARPSSSAASRFAPVWPGIRRDQFRAGVSQRRVRDGDGARRREYLRDPALSGFGCAGRFRSFLAHRTRGPAADIQDYPHGPASWLDSHEPVEHLLHRVPRIARQPAREFTKSLGSGLTAGPTRATKPAFVAQVPAAGCAAET